jgi:RHS repeat-associated protein
MNDSNSMRFTITSNPLPTGWLDQDVGPVGVVGSATFANGTFTVQGAGSSFVSTPDALHFVYQPLSGDGTIIARVVSVSNVYAQSEVMIRETLDQDAKSMAVADYANAVYSVYRTATAGSASDTNSGASSAVPYWIKLVRTGNDFTGYTSADGNNWTIFGGPQPISMQQNVYVGLGVSSGTTSSYTVTFDNVSVTSSATTAPVITSLSATTGSVGGSVTISGTGFGSTQGSSAVLLNDVAMTVSSWSSSSITVTVPTGATSGDLVVDVAPSMDSSNPVFFAVTSQPLPTGWFDQDVGQVGLAGNATYASSVFTVQGAGSSVTGTADSFHFVYQPMTADGTIVARVASGSSYGEQTVVMIRETLAPRSSEVSSALFSYSSSFYNYLYSRTLTGGSTSQAGSSSSAMPYWLEVVRLANSFSAYVSSNGSTWTQVGTTQTFTTAQTVYVGFGVSSGNPSALATATFDNVSVTAGSSLPNPVITGITPTTGAPGTSVTISGSGFGSTQGSNSSVNFNGAAATATSWSDTSIVATVPDNTTTGPISVTNANITGQGPTFTIAFNVTLTDSLGNQTTYSSSLFGGSWAFTDADGSGCSSCTTRGTIHRQYDGNGNAAWTTDALGNTVSYQYDSSNNMLSQTAQVSTNTVATTTYTYNSFGEPLTVQDALGHTTTNTYDSYGNLTSVTTPVPASGVSASVTSFAYNSLGELTSITDPLSNVTTITYNSVGLIATITDAQSNVTTYAYDSHGNRTLITDALSHQTTFAYDSMDRLTTITYPDSTTTTFAYDYRGRRTSVTDQNGKTTSYAYDNADRLTSVTDAASNVTTYGYDTENNLTSIEDANGHTTMFTYDAFGRVTQTSFPSTATETYAYDADNNLTSKTDRKGQTIQYVYDALNRLSSKTYPDSTQVDYVYDLVGKILQVNDPTGTYAFAYDNMNRLTGTTTSYSFLTGRNFTTSYAYDKASNRTGFTDPESGSSTYAYDTLNRLQTLTPPSAFTTGNFGFGYDALSRRTSLTRPNSVNTAYSYNNLSRLTSVLHQLSGSTIDGAAYTLDNAGNRTAKTDELAGVTSNYAYDAIYELTGVTQGTTTTESYTFDPVGNRLSSLGVSPYDVNVSNELTSTPSTTDTYDANGNTTTMVNSSGTTTYSWDFENRLTSVTLPGTSGTVSFKYDPFGRRIYKSSSSGTSVYAYDGDNLVEETNATGGVVARYSQGLNIDEPLAMLRSSATGYYQADGLGSVTSLSNGAGVVAQNYTYDSYGNIIATTGSLVNSFRYTGREFDTETGLYFYRARYFDPTAGRFLSEDPLRFAGGSSSFYPYAYNSPADFVDPLGLWGQGTATAPAPTTTAPPVELPIAGGAAAGAGTAAAVGGSAEGAAPVFSLIAGGSAEGGSVGGALGVAIGALAGLAVYDGIQLNNYINALRLSRDPAPQPKTPGKGCKFIKDVHMGGECKSCVYLCPGYGGLVTFGQAAEKPCPGILPNGLVDTSQLDPKCSGQKKDCNNKK